MRFGIIAACFLMAPCALAQFETSDPTSQPLRPVNSLGFVAASPEGWYYRGMIHPAGTPVAERFPAVWWEINGARGVEQQVADLTGAVLATRRDAVVCRYTSATTTYLGDDGFALPAFCPIPPSGRLAAWYDQARKRPYVDIRQPAVRNRLALWATQQAIDAGCNAVSLDNLSFGMGVPPITAGCMTRAEWEAAEISTLQRIGTTARGNGLRVFVNVACSPAAHWPLFASHVDGVLCELPLHTIYVCQRADRVESELQAYRSMLGAGKFVGLIPAEIAPASDPEYRASHARLCAAALMLVRGPGQTCGVYEPSFRPLVRDWAYWPTTMGDPTGPYRIEVGVFVRDFQRAAMRVDFARRDVSIEMR